MGSTWLDNQKRVIRAMVKEMENGVQDGADYSDKQK